MLATSPFYMSSTSHHNNYLPAIPSPLSPRSANVYGRCSSHAQSGFMSMSKEDQQAKENTNIFLPLAPGSEAVSDTPVPFSKRPVKKAPSPRQDELRERRRGAFLRKVKEGRDEGRWESRGEDVMRLEYIRRQRAWEKELAEEAPSLSSDPVEPVDEVDMGRWDDGPSSSSGDKMQVSAPSTQIPSAGDGGGDEMDAVMEREDLELEALLSYLPDDGGVSKELDKDEEMSEHLWSDDDDYEALFSEFVERDNVMAGSQNQSQQQQQQRQPQPATASQEGVEDMDVY